MSRGVSTVALMMAAMGCMDAWPKRRPLIIDGEEHEDHQLREEYEKIQRKESRLPSAERSRVVYRYEALLAMRTTTTEREGTPPEGGAA